MWDTLRDRDFGVRRQEVMQRRWGGSATFHRFLNTPDSAWDIIHSLPLEKDRMKGAVQGLEYSGKQNWLGWLFKYLT